MRWLFRKLVQGLGTAAAAVAGATVLVSGLDGSWQWLPWDAVFRVGLPAFFVGTVFFPVDARALSSRAGFTFRALLAAAAACVGHRALYALSYPEFPLVPVELDPVLMTALTATAASSVAAWLLQPAMKRLALRPRLSAGGWAPISGVTGATALRGQAGARARAGR